MRIHTNLDRDPGFVDSAYAAKAYASQSEQGIVFMECMRHGSRTHRYAFEVKLTGDGSKSKRRTNPGTSVYRRGEDLDYAATWSQWGHFLGYLYALDATMKAGPYRDADDFHRQTAGQFLYSPCHGADVVDIKEVRSMIQTSRNSALPTRVAISSRQEI